MRILIFAKTHYTAKYLAEALYIKQWSYIERRHDLYGRAGYVIIRDTDSYKKHPEYVSIQDTIDIFIDEGRMTVWDISLDWLLRTR